MVTNTKTNVKANVKSNRTKYDWDYLPHVHLLERNKPNNGKWKCPNCGGNDFDFNKDGSGFTCYSGCQDSVKVNEAFKKLAGLWVESDNNSFTSVSNQVVTVDSMTVKEKIKEARPANKTLRFDHDVNNSVYKVRLSVIYENHVKKSCYVKAVDDTGKEIEFKESGISNKDVFPYYDIFGFEHLANQINPSELLTVEGQYLASKCFDKFNSLLPTISVYGGSNFDLLATSEHLGTITNLEKVYIAPDRDKESCLKFLALGKELKKAGKEPLFYLPFPSDKIWNHLDSDLAKQYKGIDMLEDLFKNQNLTAEQFINQLQVASITLEQFERMLTGETVTAPSIVDYAVPISHYLSSQNAGVKWLVPGLIQKGVSNMIVAYSNVGKSTLCSQLAIALTQGDNFLGHELAGDKKVLYHTSDETVQDLVERVKSQGYIDTNDNFKVFNEVDGVIWDVTNLESLDLQLTHNDYDVVFMDSLSSICASAGINENSPEMGQKLTEVIKIVCNKHGKTLVIVHHANRGVLNARRLNISHICGHNSIARPLNQAIALRENTTEDGENVIDLLTVKARSSSKTELRLVRDDEGKFQVIESISTPIINTTETNNSNEKLIIDCLSQSDDWLTRDAIQGHTKLTLSTCNRLLLDLTNTGKIERAKIGKGYQYRINNLLTCSPAQDIYKSNEQENEQEAVTIDNTTSESLLLTCSNDSEQENEQVVEQVKDNLKQSEDTINVQSEVINDSLSSAKQDIVDTEKESKRDSIEVNDKVFKTGDLYYQNHTKLNVLKIDSFYSDKDGDFAKCYLCKLDKETNSIISTGTDASYELCLNNEVYRYEG